MRPHDIGRWPYTLPLRLRSVLRRRQVERDLDDELRYHIERQTEENIARGMTPSDARAAALRAFGGVQHIKEQARDTRHVAALEHLVQDFVHALRGIRHRPLFAATVVGVLTLGVAGATLIFSVVSGVLLRPLPFDDPERLVIISSAPSKVEVPPGVQPVGGEFVDVVRRNLQELESVSALQPARFNLGSAATAERVDGALVTGEFFQTLGVRPRLGKAFTSDQEIPGADHVVVLGASLWRGRFGADPRIIGRTIDLSNEPYVVIGVAPDGFEFPMAADIPGQLALPARTMLWIPRVPPLGGARALVALGRVHPGGDLAGAQRNLDRVTRFMEERSPNRKGYLEKHAAPLRTEMVGDVKGMLLTLLAGVGILLAISCANAAQLFLARLHERRKELAVRAALGASSSRIARVLMVEAALLTMLAGAIGAGLGVAGITLIRAIGPAQLPRLADIVVDWRVVAAAVGITIATGMFFGVGPSLAASRVQLSYVLRQGGRRSVASSAKVRRTLIVAEVSLSVVLLSGAGLLIRSLAAQLGASIGIDARHAITFEVTLPPHEYPEQQGTAYMKHPRSVQFFGAALERIRAIPGVEVAAIGKPLPMTGGEESTVFQGEDVDAKLADPARVELTSYTIASPGMFTALGATLRAGRDFTDADREETVPVVIVNEAMARWLWPGQSAIGHRVKLGSALTKSPWMTVVGVVADMKRYSLTKDAAPEIYVPYTQRPYPSFSTMPFIVRTEADPARIVPLIRREIAQVDPTIPVANVRTIDALVSDAAANARFASLCMTVFGASALLLAMVGLYGVIAHAVQQRRQEFGLRTALGASGAQMIRLVLADGLRVALGGIAIGTIAALIVTYLLRSMLYGVSAFDPATFAVTIALLLGATIVACCGPAVRAARADPRVVLDG